MYKVSYEKEATYIAGSLIAVLFLIALRYFAVNIPIDDELRNDCVFMFWFFIIIAIVLFVYGIKCIFDTRWLAKNGKLARNLPYETKIEKNELAGPGPFRRDIYVIVKYKDLSGRKLEFSDTISFFGRKLPNKAIDVLYDEKNPNRFYLGFDIEKI